MPNFKKHTQLGTAPTMKAAAGRTGIDLETIKLAKAAGCPAFSHRGSVDCDALAAWLPKNQSRLKYTPCDVYQLRRLAVQIEKLEFQLSERRKQYVPLSLVKEWGVELDAAIRKIVQQMHTCAADVVGLDVAGAEKRLKEVEAQTLEQLHELPSKLSKWNGSESNAD